MPDLLQAAEALLKAIDGHLEGGGTALPGFIFERALQLRLACPLAREQLARRVAHA